MFNYLLIKTFNTLIYNIEYTKDGTSFNHVVNNYKGLILCSILLNRNKQFLEFNKLFIKELKIITEKDYFIREGSSHYQFIISK